MTYEKYQSDCKQKGFKPTMTQKQFNEMEFIEKEEFSPPLRIIPKRDARPISSTFKDYNESK